MSNCNCYLDFDFLDDSEMDFDEGSYIPAQDIADGSITTAKLADSAVTTAKIANGNVTAEKLAANIPLTDISINEDSVEIQTTVNGTVKNEAVPTYDAFDELKESVETKADANGEYDSMLVGTAKQLLSDKYTENTAPYIFRQTPVRSTREEDCIVGGSLGWNQLADYSKRSQLPITINGLTCSYVDGVFHVEGTATSRTAFVLLTSSTPINHVLFIHGFPSNGSISTYWGGFAGVKIDFGQGGIWKNDTDVEKLNLRIDFSSDVGSVNLDFSPQYTDLTALFGSTIADYIYSLEQATAGAGVAWVQRYIDLSVYHEYDAGSIKSVEGLSAHVMRDSDNNIIGNYPLDSNVTLRGIPKLDSSNELYFDGDTYEADGTVTRRYAERAYQSGDESLVNAITDGTTTVYKLATPTTETAEPYQQIQICDPYGTEEYVTSGVVPVGHQTKYYEDLKGKIEALPWDFSNMIAVTEATNKATRNYSVGDYLVYSNTLYKVTAAIASGGTITVGTNVTATTIMAEIKALQ